VLGRIVTAAAKGAYPGDYCPQDDLAGLVQSVVYFMNGDGENPAFAAKAPSIKHLHDFWQPFWQARCGSLAWGFRLTLASLSCKLFRGLRFFAGRIQVLVRRGPCARLPQARCRIENISGSIVLILKRKSADCAVLARCHRNFGTVRFASSNLAGLATSLD